MRVVLAAFAAAAVVACPASAVAPKSFEQLVGQTIVTGLSGQAPSASLLARIRSGQVGGVVLFGRNIGSDADVARLVSQLQAAAAAGGNPPLLVAVDQEGGAVKRLADGPPDVSPRTLGEEGDVGHAAAEGTATASFLRGLGVDVDLAPVLDTPDSLSSWLGSRAYSRSRFVNATLGTAFLNGLQQGGVAATAKHFPGLGTARTTTDTAAVVVDTSASGLDRRLLPFRRAIAAGVSLVMVSNAGYRAYDPTGTPAALSQPIVTGLLRNRLGFKGVVITDALEAPGPRSHRQAPVEALRAGVDLLLYTYEQDGADAFDQLVAAARAGALPLATLERAGVRIAALKRQLAHR
jgi:beta-N-acetylhexosaminidase